MFDAKDALAVVANHEYNAIAFHTPRPGEAGPMNSAPFDKKFETASGDIGSDGARATLIVGSLGFGLCRLRLRSVGSVVTHVSWQTRNIECLNEALADVSLLKPSFLTMSEDTGSDLSSGLNRAIENVLNGPQLQLPDGHLIVDKAGHR